MNYFKKNGEVFAFDDDQLHLVTEAFTPMTPSEVNQHITPKPSQYHTTWDDTNECWIDTRTDAQKISDHTAELPPLTRRQFKLVLLEKGMLDQVDTLIAGITDPATKSRIQIEYADATTFVRTSTSVIYMCSLLGLNESQINDMWDHGLTL